MMERILDYIEARRPLRLLAGYLICMALSFALLLLFTLVVHADEARRGAEYAPVDHYAQPVDDGPIYPRRRRDDYVPEVEPLDPALLAGPRTCYTFFSAGMAFTRCN